MVKLQVPRERGRLEGSGPAARMIRAGMSDSVWGRRDLLSGCAVL